MYNAVQRVKEADDGVRVQRSRHFKLSCNLRVRNLNVPTKQQLRIVLDEKKLTVTEIRHFRANYPNCLLISMSFAIITISTRPAYRHSEPVSWCISVIIFSTLHLCKRQKSSLLNTLRDRWKYYSRSYTPNSTELITNKVVRLSMEI